MVLFIQHGLNRNNKLRAKAGVRNDKTQQVLESLYTQADLVPSIESIKQELISASQTEDNPEGKLDVLKLNDRLKSRLIEAEPVSEASLKSLALSRQKTVMTFIQTQSDLTAERLRANESITIEASEDWIALPFKLGTT